jgi:Ku protein
LKTTLAARSVQDQPRVGGREGRTSEAQRPLCDLLSAQTGPRARGPIAGVNGKLALWRALRDLSDHDERLDPQPLDRLIDRAERQIGELRGHHHKDSSPIEHRRICPNEGREVDYDDIVKGYEVKAGEWVELTDDEIAAAAGSAAASSTSTTSSRPPTSTRPASSAPTISAPARAASRPYAVLHAALGRSGRAGVGRWIFHNRERTVIVRTRGRALAMHTMRFAAQRADPEDLEPPRLQSRPGKRELEMAASLVKGLHARSRALQRRRPRARVRRKGRVPDR